MLNILIAGCGNIGSRHLQSLKLCNLPLCVYVYDPFNPSLEKAKTIWDSTNGTNHKIHFVNNFDTVPNTIFTCIIATNSADRLDIFKLIADNFTVKHFILEKFLFSKVEEYEKAMDIISQSDADIFVNCPRRLFAPYHSLKDELQKIQSIEITGNSWGLCSNSIHFIDLIHFLTNKIPVSAKFNTSLTTIIPSKRQGYHETTGELICSYDEFIAKLNCDLGEFEGIQLKILANKAEYLIGEKNNIISIYKNGKLLTEGKMKFQSELTAMYINNLHSNVDTGLTRFEDSCGMHLAFLSAINTLANNINYKGEIKIS